MESRSRSNITIFIQNYPHITTLIRLYPPCNLDKFRDLRNFFKFKRKLADYKGSLVDL